MAEFKVSAGGWRAVPVILAFSSAFLFGASTPLSKLLLDQFHPLMLAGLLYLGAAVFLLPWLAMGRVRGKTAMLPRSTKNRLRLLGAIIFGGVLGPVLLLLGLRAAPAASVSLWLNLETLATALMAVVFFREHLTKSAWIANGGVFLAGALLSVGDGWSGVLAGSLVMGACVCWGMDNNLTALIDDISPATSTFWKGLVAGVTNCTIGLWLTSTPSLSAVGGALLLGGLAYGVSITLYINAAQGMGATRSQMVFSSAPFFGVLLSVLLLGERLVIWQILAALVLAVSLWLMLSERHAHSHRHEALSHDHVHRHDDRHHGHVHEGMPGTFAHSGWHQHQAVEHSHPHWPDLHHRHDHDS